MSDDGPRRSRQWPRALFTATGLLATALVTTYVIKTGAAATTAGAPGTAGTAPRTVVATYDAAPAGQTDPAAANALERSVRVAGTAPAARPTVDLRTVVYTVAGNQRPEDPVTVVYADETGTLQTAANVTLPWTLTVTPELPVNYVSASSRGSQLNCWITDAAGTTVAAQTDFGPSTACNR